MPWIGLTSSSSRQTQLLPHNHHEPLSIKRLNVQSLLLSLIICCLTTSSSQAIESSCVRKVYGPTPWLSEHLRGTKDEFTHYVNSLTQAEIKDLKKQVADLVSSFANPSDFIQTYSMHRKLLVGIGY
jgi:hypothetical protein